MSTLHYHSGSLKQLQQQKYKSITAPSSPTKHHIHHTYHNENQHPNTTHNTIDVSEIQQLKADKQSLQQQITQLKKVCLVMANQSKSTTNESDKQRITELESEKRTLIELLSKCDKSLIDINSKIQVLVNEKNQLETELLDTKHNLSDITEKYNTLKSHTTTSNYEQLQYNYTQLQQNNTELQAEIEKLQQQNNDFNTMIQQQNDVVNTLQEQLYHTQLNTLRSNVQPPSHPIPAEYVDNTHISNTDTKQLINKAYTERMQLKSQITELQSSNIELQQQLTTEQSNNTVLNDRINALQCEIQRYVELLNENATTIRLLNNDKLSIQAQLQTTTDTLQLKTEEISVICTDFTNLLKSYDSIQQQYNTLQQQYNDVQQHFESSNTSKSAIETEYTRLQQHYNALCDKYNYATVQFTQLNNSATQIDSENKTLKSECNEYKHEITRLKLLNSQYEQQYSILQENYTKSFTINHTVETEKQNAVKQTELLLQKINDLSNQLRIVQNLNVELEQKNIQCQSKISELIQTTQKLELSEHTLGSENKKLCGIIDEYKNKKNGLNCIINDLRQQLSRG